MPALSFRTYLLRCADGSFYAGHTDDLDRRMAQHRAGDADGYTAPRPPVELVWSAEAPTREEALAFEQQIKGWSRAKKEALIREDWGSIKQLAIPPGERALRLRSGRTDGSRNISNPFALSEVEGPSK